MAVTISDVAKHAGVSKSTVSNFLNGKYEMMSKETREVLEKTVKELAYTPNLSARRLPNKDKSRTVCLIIPRNLTHIFDTMYYPTVFHSIEKMAEEMKFNVLIYSRNRTDSYNEMQYLKGLAGSIVDGFLIYDLPKDDEFFREFQNSGIPYVCVGKIDGVDDYNYVASDHYKAFIDTFPAGTLSGAPKVRALQLINEMEPHNRGAYGGCIGSFNFNGDLNQAIVIRTFISRNGELWFQAGSGVTAKSNDEYELQESNNKLGALVKAIKEAEKL